MQFKIPTEDVFIGQAASNFGVVIAVPTYFILKSPPDGCPRGRPEQTSENKRARSGIIEERPNHTPQTTHHSGVGSDFSETLRALRA